MSDAGSAEGAEQDLDFGLEKGQLSGMEGLREGAFSYRSDPFSGELTGGPTDKGAGGGGVTVAPELSAAGESAADIKSKKEEKPAEIEEPEKPAEKKRPAITRAKRRRSLLTEEEGGVLRKPPIYRRSILGR